MIEHTVPRGKVSDMRLSLCSLTLIGCATEAHPTEGLGRALLPTRFGFPLLEQDMVSTRVGVDHYSGWVTTVVDGNYDRCHTDLGAITCDGHPVEPNYIVIEHPDGIRSEYIHLMKDSIVVEEGQEVQCGDLLGRVGSSGYSSMPHLHFEVELDGEWIDPYAGPFSQAESLWELQGNDFSLPEPGCTAR
jgi:hypothetical protein